MEDKLLVVFEVLEAEVTVEVVELEAFWLQGFEVELGQFFVGVRVVELHYLHVAVEDLLVRAVLGVHS